MKRKPALLALSAYVVGILLGNYLNASTFVLLFLILALLALLFFSFQDKSYRFIFLIILLVLTGFWRYELKSRDFPINHISHFTELYSKVELTGTISKDPDIREDKTFVEVIAQELCFNQKKIKTTGKILLKIKHPTNNFNYGDLILMKGYLYSPFPPKNPGAFDYKKYLSSRDIFGCVNIKRDSEIRILNRGEGNLLISKIILPLKHYMLNSFKSNLSNPHQAILCGFVLGERRGIPKEINKLFTDTGTLHLLAISGSNVALVVFLFFGFFRIIRIPFKISLLFIFPLILIFSNVTGNQPSVVRASIMTSFFLFSLLIERERDLINIWALAAFLILLIFPYSLFDVGFQLSFAATLGLIVWVPKLEKLFLYRFQNRFLRNYIVLPFFISLSAQLFTYPIIAYYFNAIPLYSLLANLLIVPLTGLVVMVGVISLASGVLNFKLFLLFVSFNWVGLEFIIRILSFFSSLPYAVIKVPSPSYLFILIFYFSLFSIILQRDLKRLGIATLISVLFFTGFFFLIESTRSKPSDLKITYLSTAGEAVLVEIPSGEKVFINLAQKPWEVEKIILPYLYRRGVTKLDGLIITDQNDISDRLSGLLREIKIEEIWVGSENITSLKKHFGDKTQISILEELNQHWSKVKVFSVYPDKNSERGYSEITPLLMLGYGEFKLLLAKSFLPENLAVEFQPDIVSFNPDSESLANTKQHILTDQQVSGLIISGYEKLKFHRVERRKIFQISETGAVMIEVGSKCFKISTVLGKRKLICNFQNESNR